MFRNRKKPYVIVVINNDDTGRVHYVSSPPTTKEEILHGILLNMMGDGAFKSVHPGRYRFEMTRMLPRPRYDLIPE